MIDIEKVKNIIEEVKNTTIDIEVWDEVLNEYNYPEVRLFDENDKRFLSLFEALTELYCLQQNQITLNRYLELEAKGINISKIDWDEKKKMLHILQMNKEMLGSEVK